jgi:3-hydroxy-9,10-secoandrosta-1,3,5(10)-triene-9,17-dione monooxygenase
VAPAIGREDYLERVRTLLPAIRDRAAATEELGRIPDETIAELKEAGVLGGLQPRRWEGLELDPATFFEGIVLLGSACASTGWVASVLGMHPWEVASMHPDAQADVWSDDPGTCVSSSYAPTGAARREGDGYWVSGWWGFSSGVDHAGWALLAALVEGEEKEGPRVFLVDRDNFEIDHTSWEVAGLAGTGSKSVDVPGLFVPAYRTHTMVEINNPSWQRPGWEIADVPLYHFGFTDLFSWGIGGPALGAATGFAEEWVRQSTSRAPGFGGPKVAEKVELKLNLADGLNRVNVLTRSMVSAWSELSDVLERGEPLDRGDQLALHYLGSRSIPDALDAVLVMFATSGGGVMNKANPLQRFLRDLLAMRNHPVASLERFGGDLASHHLTPPTG